MKVRFASDDYGTAVSKRLETCVSENKTVFNVIQYEKNRHSKSDDVYINWAVKTPHPYAIAYNIYRDGTYRKILKAIYDRMYININKDVVSYMEKHE